MVHASPLPYRASTVWVVVADDAHARVYVRLPRTVVVKRNATDGGEVLSWSLQPLADMTLTASDGSHLPLETADRLNKAHASGRFDGVVIVAPASWLGEIRPHLSQDAKDAVVLEIGKDLTKLPRARLLQRLNDLLPSREGAPL